MFLYQSYRLAALTSLTPSHHIHLPLVLLMLTCSVSAELHTKIHPAFLTTVPSVSSQEHHLQRAISAQQVYGEKRDNMVIPVPEAESNITYYDSLYPGDYKMPKQLIHIQRECVNQRLW